jgi:rSAM/selenodomain-associated transferase 1
MNNNALIILAKYPENGSVKTRLQGHMPDDKILKLYNHLLEHAVDNLRSINGIDTFIAFAPPEAEKFFSKFDVKLIPLPEGDIGQRMCYAFSSIFADGYGKAALVGTDIPELSASVILKAFDQLSDNDLVFGPARDGGYYLIGMKMLIREVFDDVPWSSEQTLRKSIEKARLSGYSMALTETLTDIDTIEDVKDAGLDLFIR